MRRQRRSQGWICRQFHRCSVETGLQSTFIAFLIACFLYFNHYVRDQLQKRRDGVFGRIITARLREQWISPNQQPFDDGGVASSAKNLIIVAGHSVTISGHLEDASFDERDWFLLDYQKSRGLPQAIVAHIRAGVNEASKDPSALLVFSGGQTRSVTGPESEGSSYYRVADAMQLWKTHPLSTSNNNKSDTNYFIANNTVRARTVTEEYATDSFENLLFSICRFHEITGLYPAKVSVVSFSFKERRFRNLHIPALQYPADKFYYIGVDPPSTSGFNLNESTNGELENAAKPFENDPYGCYTNVLQQKRKSRNPFARTPPYDLSCPEMKILLHYCGPDIISRDQVPW